MKKLDANVKQSELTGPHLTECIQHALRTVASHGVGANTEKLAALISVSIDLHIKAVLSERLGRLVQ